MTRLAKIREALEFYADVENWDGAELQPWDNEEAPSSGEHGWEEDCDKHNGKRAREALAELDKLGEWPSLSEAVDWHTDYITEHGGGDLNMIAAYTAWLRSNFLPPTREISEEELDELAKEFEEKHKEFGHSHARGFKAGYRAAMKGMR